MSAGARRSFFVQKKSRNTFPLSNILQRILSMPGFESYELQGGLQSGLAPISHNDQLATLKKYKIDNQYAVFHNFSTLLRR
jgi:hypothetical protein